MKKFGVAAAAVCLLLTSGCGGGRPSEGDLSKAIQSGSDQLGGVGAAGAEVTEKSADCMAEAMHDSKVSDEALQAIVDKDEDYKPSKGDEKALKNMVPEFLKCIPGMADLQKQLGDMDPEKLQEQLDGLSDG